MPRKYYRKKVVKKKYKKRQYHSSNYSTVQKIGRTVASFPGSGFPDKLNCKLRYTEQLIISASSHDFIFSGNSVYDPNYSAVGTQPRYFDQLAAIYSQYYVKASKMTIQCLNQGSEPFGYCILAHSDPTARTFTYAIEERDGTPFQVIHPYVSLSKKLQCYATTKDIVQYQSKHQLEAAVTTSPTEQWFFHVCAANLTSVPTSNSGSITISIEYYVTFYNRFRIAPS